MKTLRCERSSSAKHHIDYVQCRRRLTSGEYPDILCQDLWSVKGAQEKAKSRDTPKNHFWILYEERISTQNTIGAIGQKETFEVTQDLEKRRTRFIWVKDVKKNIALAKLQDEHIEKRVQGKWSRDRVSLIRECLDKKRLSLRQEETSEAVQDLENKQTSVI